jgi:hypothetical protein
MPKAKFGQSGPPDLPGEPEGWRELQERARNAPNSIELDAIITEMNRLLAECERSASSGEGGLPGSPRGGPKLNSKVE